ncbi:peroxiredoxin family protein [Halovenus marina]|uniref:peroxiredoxin family protein n=1 Tax=Halovenus marina TaxID=3396621 RepID=UPI003F569237
MELAVDFELENVGSGPDPLAFRSLAADNDFVALFFQRDYYCTNCRKQVQTLASRYEEFRERNAAVVSIVPEPADRLEDWQSDYDLPFPLCADPDTRVSSEYDQPVRFGVLGRFSDFFGRMPKIVMLDCRGDTPEIIYTHEGSSTWDRPEIDDLLDVIDAHR